MRKYIIHIDPDILIRNQLEELIEPDSEYLLLESFREIADIFNFSGAQQLDFLLIPYYMLDEFYYLEERIRSFLGKQLNVVFTVDWDRSQIEKMEQLGVPFLIKPFEQNFSFRLLNSIWQKRQEQLNLEENLAGRTKEVKRLLICTKKQDHYLNCSDLLFVFVDRGVVFFISYQHKTFSEQKHLDFSEEYYKESCSASRKEVMYYLASQNFDVLKSSKEFSFYQKILLTSGFGKIGKSMMINLNYLFMVNKDSSLNHIGWNQNRSTCTMKKDLCTITLPLEKEYRMRIQRYFAERMHRLNYSFN